MVQIAQRRVVVRREMLGNRFDRLFGCTDTLLLSITFWKITFP